MDFSVSSIRASLAPSRGSSAVPGCRVAVARERPISSSQLCTTSTFCSMTCSARPSAKRAVEPACRSLPRIAKAQRHLRTRKLCHHCRFDCSLQVERRVVFLRPHSANRRQKLAPGSSAQQVFAPATGIGQMHFVHQRTSRAARACQFNLRRAQQLAPAPFDHPADPRLRQRAAQHGHGGQCVEHIAHRAQAHNQRPRIHLWIGRIYSHIRSKQKRQGLFLAAQRPGQRSTESVETPLSCRGMSRTEIRISELIAG